jgi:uncharacterized membrane protein
MQNVVSMSTYVRTGFTPLRLIAGQQTPIMLGVEIRNKADAQRNYSITVKTPTQFAFGEEMVFREERKRIEGVAPLGSKEATFRIRPKFNVQPGFYDFEIVVRAHDDRFDKVVEETKTFAKLRVEK